MADELEKRLTQSSLTGVPLLNPDEQNYFLGNFKERVVAALTLEELDNLRLQDLLMKEFANYPEGNLFINGKAPSPLQETYLKLATKANIPFTFVTNDSKAASCGVVFALKTPLHLPEVFLSKKYPLKKATVSSPPEKEEKKTSFWKKLF